MKKILAFILSTALVASFVSCNKNDEENSNLASSSKISEEEEAATEQMMATTLVLAEYCNRLTLPDILPKTGEVDEEGYIEISTDENDYMDNLDFLEFLKNVDSQEAALSFFQTIFSEDATIAKGIFHHVFVYNTYKFSDGKIYYNTNVTPRPLNNGGYDIMSIRITDVTEKKITASVFGESMGQTYKVDDMELVKEGEVWKLTDAYIMGRELDN